MAVGRLSERARASAAIWPGFVDAMTALLLVLMFVLSIFMLVQFVLRTQITGQETVIDAQEDRIGQLNAQLSAISNQLAMEVTKGEELDRELTVARATLSSRDEEIGALSEERAALRGRVASFEAQVAALLAERGRLEENVAALAAERDREIDAKAALDLALARAREEIDAGAEAARRAAAEREALEALTASLRAEQAAGGDEISRLRAEEAANLALLKAMERERDEARARAGEIEGRLSEEERLRLASIAAADALRERLRNADSELTAMTLALEDKRREAEETLTLLAAAEAAKAELTASLSGAASAREREAALLALARERLADSENETSEQARALALLNEQAAELRLQLGGLSAQLDASEEKDRASQTQIANLGSRLNAALAREVQLKAREAERLRAEKESLEAYRSEFFGEMRKALGSRPDIRIVGDRFIFQSEVLFATGSAQLGSAGRAELSNLGGALREAIARIPPGIDWLLVVEGHTDDVPISGGRYRDNWELSQARALSVVSFLTEFENVPPERLAALGYGEFQPVDAGDTPEARARNRRIELKFTERPARGE